MNERCSDLNCADFFLNLRPERCRDRCNVETQARLPLSDLLTHVAIQTSGRGPEFSAENAHHVRLRQYPHRDQSGCNLPFSLFIERESIRARDDQGFAG